MKPGKIFILVATVFLLTACAKKLPLPQSPEDGLLVVPTNGEKHFMAKYVYRYQFDFNNNEKIVVKIVDGSSFITKSLPKGTYKFDSMKSFGQDTARVTASNKNVKTIKLGSTYSFEIKPGKITYFPFGVGAELKGARESYTQYYRPFELDEKISRQYKDLIMKAENSGKWTF